MYPGIDLVYYGNQRQLEYDLVVRPGADPRSIVLAFQGADRLEVDAQGDLVLHTADGAIRQRKPLVYQEVDGVRKEIAGGYVLRGAQEVAFRVAAYDASRPLFIDPVLIYSTYLGGSGSDGGVGIAVDGSGNAYVTGFTGSTNFPTANALQPAFGGIVDAFVTKVNPAGSALLYSTYLGGSGFDEGFGIAVDGSGNAYVTGLTTSTNFPTANPIQPAFGGGEADAFVTKMTEVITVQIDIMPGTFPNNINLASRGVVPVAILTTPSFNAATVNVSTVLFAGAAPLRSALEDVDGDGDLDRGSPLCHPGPEPDLCEHAGHADRPDYVRRFDPGHRLGADCAGQERSNLPIA